MNKGSIKEKVIIMVVRITEKKKKINLLGKVYGSSVL